MCTSECAFSVKARATCTAASTPSRVPNPSCRGRCLSPIFAATRLQMIMAADCLNVLTTVVGECQRLFIGWVKLHRTAELVLQGGLQFHQFATAHKSLVDDSLFSSPTMSFKRCGLKWSTLVTEPLWNERKEARTSSTVTEVGNDECCGILG